MVVWQELCLQAASSVELRLCPGQNGKKGHLDPIKEAVCVSIPEGTVALKIPGLSELLRLGLVFSRKEFSSHKVNIQKESVKL